jgi:hypothetical protein
VYAAALHGLHTMPRSGDPPRRTMRVWGLSDQQER